jgi:hypothetical protein
MPPTRNTNTPAGAIRCDIAPGTSNPFPDAASHMRGISEGLRVSGVSVQNGNRRVHSRGYKVRDAMVARRRVRVVVRG